MRPIPDRDDPRLASVRYAAGEPFRLQVPVGSEVTVLLPAGERLTAVSVAAPGDWQVTVQGAAEAFIIRPNRPVPDTTMSVLTAARSYSFVLSSAPTGGAPLLVRITGVPRASDDTGIAASPAQGAASWRLSGNRELWPALIRDDGTKTYLEWRTDQAIPAVFALDRLGREEMVNGYMRGATFIIDRVHERLLLRIDKASAEARRKPAKAPR